MSYYETAEQRQIREQRNRIERLTAELNGTSAQRDALRRERENVLRRVQRENERLSRQIRQQQQAADRKVGEDIYIVGVDALTEAVHASVYRITKLRQCSASTDSRFSAWRQNIRKRSRSFRQRLAAIVVK